MSPVAKGGQLTGDFRGLSSYKTMSSIGFLKCQAEIIKKYKKVISNKNKYNKQNVIDNSNGVLYTRFKSDRWRKIDATSRCGIIQQRDVVNVSTA